MRSGDQGVRNPAGRKQRAERLQATEADPADCAHPGTHIHPVTPPLVRGGSYFLPLAGPALQVGPGTGLQQKQVSVADVRPLTASTLGPTDSQSRS